MAAEMSARPAPAQPALGDLAYGTPIDLGNCEREPIHIPGQIQPHGVLLALDMKTLTVLQASDNTAAQLGQPVLAVLGKAAAELLQPVHLAQLQRALGSETLEDNPLFLFTAEVCGAGPFHVIGQVHDGLLLLELEVPEAASALRPDFYELIKRSVSRFQSARTVREFSAMVVDEVRRVSGYDRVMVYRFAPDWSGHVIGESMAPGKGLESYLGLHYPASDIPAQARALFQLNTVRMLPDARYLPARIVPELNPRTGKPLDLSYTFLRGASQMYTEYLTNMGVRGTLTLAITKGDRLWGMLVCHHYSPRQIPYDVRAACELLARVVSMQMADKQAQEEAGYQRRLSEVHDAIVRSLARHDELAEGLLDCAPNAGAFLEGASVAVIANGRCRLLGPTPPEAQVRALARWLDETQGAEVFATDTLPSLYPPAAGFEETACGVLAVRVSRAGGEYVIWMRPEMIRTEQWAGDPKKPVETGPFGDRLTPRKSFALWQETVRGRSAPFTEVERVAAGRLRTALADRALLASEAYRGSVVNSLQDHVVVVDPQGVIVDVNEAWRRFALENGGDAGSTGIGANYLRACARVLPGTGDGTAAATLQGIRAVIDGRAEKFALEYACHSPKQRRWFSLRVSRAAGRAPGSVVVAHTDVTTIKETEEKLRDALREKDKLVREVYAQNQRVEEASRLKSEFLANMSHELRTPLNGIIGFSELLFDGKAGAASEVQREYLGDILSSARHLHELINDVLDLTKVESGKLEFHHDPVDLGLILREATDLLRTEAAKKRIAVETAVDPALPEVVIDASRFRQVLFNYLSNALKFTPEQGRVRVSVATEGADRFRLEVQDTGIGIKEEDLARLFVEFQQLDASRAKRYPGTGLGLALTRRIVEAQGGLVGVRSEPGKGSVFFAVLPLRPLAWGDLRPEEQPWAKRRS